MPVMTSRQGRLLVPLFWTALLVHICRVNARATNEDLASNVPSQSGDATARATFDPNDRLDMQFRFRSGATVAEPPALPNYYYDASNMPSWLTPPWVTSAFRTGPLALPLPSKYSTKEGPMFAGVPAQPILPFDNTLGGDNVPISQNFVNYPNAAVPSGKNPGSQAPALDFIELEQKVERQPQARTPLAPPTDLAAYAAMSRFYALQKQAEYEQHLMHQMHAMYHDVQRHMQSLDRDD